MSRQRAEEEQTSREVLRSVQRALKEALLALPAEEYDWFDVHQSTAVRPKPKTQTTAGPLGPTEILSEFQEPNASQLNDAPPQKDFFEFPGPLFSCSNFPSLQRCAGGGTQNLASVATRQIQSACGRGHHVPLGTSSR
jgi:hypothetical protein